MKNAALFALGLFAATLAGPARAAPDLVVSGGVLIGANGVSVNGALYDVRFLDGTCLSLFSGCDSLSDFTFTEASAVNAASRALLDQVFVDGPLGDFDSRPSLTRGCADNTGQGFCAVFTPADTLVNNSLAQNSSLEAGDLVRVAFTLPGEDLTIYDATVYAVWTPQAAPIPEPAAAGLLAAGLALLRLRLRRGR